MHHKRLTEIADWRGATGCTWHRSDSENPEEWGGERELGSLITIVRMKELHLLHDCTRLCSRCRIAISSMYRQGGSEWKQQGFLAADQYAGHWLNYMSYAYSPITFSGQIWLLIPYLGLFTVLPINLLPYLSPRPLVKAIHGLDYHFTSLFVSSPFVLWPWDVIIFAFVKNSYKAQIYDTGCWERSEIRKL